MTAARIARRPGRPLQFLGLALGGWIGARAAMLALPLAWQTATAPMQPVVAHRDGPVPAPARPASAEATRANAVPPARPLRREQSPAAARSGGGGGWDRETFDAMLGATLAFRRPRGPLSSLQAAANEAGIETGPGAVAAPGPVWLPGGGRASAASAQSRWSLVGWTLWRPEDRATLGQGPLLGGSQAGLRLDYALGGGLSLYGRATRAFDASRASDAALGLSWQPHARVPIALMAERRQRIGRNGRSGFALLAAGGVGPRALADRVELEGYAQGGIVGLPGADAFADGRLTIDYRLTGRQGRPGLAIGATVAGSAQPGAARLDLGPAVRLRLPFAPGNLRLSAEWRARIAGDARPAHGPAITLVADF